MKCSIACDGRKLTGPQAAALGAALAAAIQPEMAQTMAAQGFALCAMRAPRMRNGELVIRICWKKREDGVRTVIRGTIILQAPTITLQAPRGS